MQQVVLQLVTKVFLSSRQLYGGELGEGAEQFDKALVKHGKTLFLNI